jgi:hypothetical protein
MKKLLDVLLVFFLTGFLNIGAQTIIEEGDDLLATVEAAEDGTEIIIQPGVYKASYNTINIDDKSLVIRGAEDSPKPIVYLKSFSLSGTDISLTLQGIEFSGADFDSLIGIEDTVTLKGEYLINLKDTFHSGNDIIIRDCIIRNFQKSVIRGDRADNHVNNILVDDCIIFDLRGGSSYGPFRLKSHITFDDFTIQNSTFHHIQGSLVDCKDMVPYPAVVEINHCTFYKWGGIIPDKYLFDFAANNQASISILNSILAQTNNDDLTNVWGFRLGVVAYKEMSFCVMTPDFSLDDSTYAQTEWNSSDFTYEDYEVNFEYPDTSNFTIPLGDDLYEMSDEGTLLGDPRWSAIVEPGGIGSILGSDEFIVYPVPAREYIYLMNGRDGTVEIFNPLGMKIDEIHLRNSAVYTLDLSNYEKGIYILRMNNRTKQIIVE